MRKIIFTIIVLFSLGVKAQDSDKTNINPKLVIGLVVDQMRYDYLFRYWDKLSDGGLKKMLSSGYSFKNANFSYLPTYTAPGHATIYSGTTPAVHGIAANTWYDNDFKVMRYCVDDRRFKSVGTQTEEGDKSPGNLTVTTIGGGTVAVWIKVTVQPFESVASTSAELQTHFRAHSFITGISVCISKKTEF